MRIQEAQTHTDPYAGLEHFLEGIQSYFVVILYFIAQQGNKLQRWGSYPKGAAPPPLSGVKAGSNHLKE